MNAAPADTPARLLDRRDLLAITAVVDIALNARGRPVSAASLAERNGLRPRHLEPLLQALVHHGILKGTRGPRGGYELARERRRISAAAIVRAARGTEERAPAAEGSALLRDVVAPAMAEVERSFAAALAAVTIEDLVRRATSSSGHAGEIDFTI